MRKRPQIQVNLNRHFYWLLLSTALIALLLRIIVAGQLQSTRAATDPLAVTDMQTYLHLAASIIHGDFPDTFYYQPFYYSVFLPLTMLLFGSSPLALGMVQAIIGGLTVVLTGWTANRWFGPRAGLLAAGCLALARFHIFYTPFALMAVLQSFWLAAIVGWSSRLEQASSPRNWGWFGLLIGCANLTRGNIIILVPGALGWLAWLHWGQWTRLAGRGTIFIIAIFAIQLPFSLYNWRQTGDWTGPSTAANAVLALGNNPEAPPGGLVYPPTYEAWIAAANQESGAKSVAGSIIDWLKHEPLAWPELKLRAFLLFWAPLEIPNNVNFEVEGKASLLLRQPFLLNYWKLASLGLAGLLMSLAKPGLRRRKALLFAAYCIVAYCAGTVAFYILARFRLPIVPVLCIFAGYAIDRVCSLFRVLRHRGLTSQVKRTATVLLLTLLLPSLFVLRSFEFYQNRLEARVIRLARPNGVMAIDQDNILIYDHGPQFLGDWSLIEISPSPEKTIISKEFSLPYRDQLDKRQPEQLRIPVFFSGPGRLTLEVEQQNRMVGQLSTGFIDQTNQIRWFEIDLTIQQQDWPGESITLHIKATAEAAETVYLVVDLRRDYGRTRIQTTRQAELRDLEETGLEACLQLVFGQPQVK